MVTSLAKIHRQLAVAAKFTTNVDEHPRMSKSTPVDCLKIVLHLWLNGGAPLPPTWRSLYQVLKELDLEEMGDHIQECLTGER